MTPRPLTLSTDHPTTAATETSTGATPRDVEPSRRDRGRPRRAVTAATAAVALSALLAVVAAVDQVGDQGLVDHATAAYAAQDERPSSAVLYGLVHSVAAVNVLLWLGVRRFVRRRRRSAPIVAFVAGACSAALAVALLTASEYGETIFPPGWGGLALLPGMAGALVGVLLLRTRDPRPMPSHRGAR